MDDPKGEAWGPPVRRPTEPFVVSGGAAMRGAIIAAFPAPFVALLPVGTALPHQAANPVAKRHQQIENIGVLGIPIAATAALGWRAVRRVQAPRPPTLSVGRLPLEGNCLFLHLHANEARAPIGSGPCTHRANTIPAPANISMTT